MAEKILTQILTKALEKFKHMTLTKDTLSYMEMEVNDMFGRLYPDKKPLWYIAVYQLKHKPRAVSFAIVPKH